MVNTRKRPQARKNARDAIPAPGHFRQSIENCSKAVFFLRISAGSYVGFVITSPGVTFMPINATQQNLNDLRSKSLVYYGNR